jgi:osmoprotectant transport system ATP-binding protein
MAAETPMISLDGVRKVFPGTPSPAVTDLSFDVAEGEVIVLVGPSGCGKTTTLKMINRLIEPSGGTITVAGRDILSVEPHVLRRDIGYVIQQIGLFPHRTIAENISTVPRLLGWEKPRIAARVDELIGLVDLEEGMRDRYPAELSGGQRQRVGVARALAADPPVLLMDEPFGAVDPIVRARLQDELLDLQARVHKTIVLVTHDIDEAIKLGDRVAILDVGGILKQYDAPYAILAEPADAFVEDFLGQDRGIKRLSLIKIEDVELETGPVVAPSASPAEANRVMDSYGIDFVGIVADDRLLGWVDRSSLGAVARAGDAALQAPAVRLSCDDSLREALDEIITSHVRIAPVFDREERLLGMLTADRIGREITQ